MKSEHFSKKMELREMRLRLGFTQQDLADSLGMNSRYISMVESGLKPCSEKMLKKVELLFDAKQAQAPPGAPAVVCHDKIRSEPCPRCAELERDLKEARAVIRDQASAIAALAAKPTVPPAGPACGAGCGISGVSKQKERKGA